MNAHFFYLCCVPKDIYYYMTAVCSVPQRTVRQVAAFFSCTNATIYSLIGGHRTTGSTSDTHRSGRPRVTSAAEDRYSCVTTLSIGL